MEVAEDAERAGWLLDVPLDVVDCCFGSTAEEAGADCGDFRRLSLPRCFFALLRS